VKKRDAKLSQQLYAGLTSHEARRKLAGISGNGERECLIEQLIESVRRVQYPQALRSRDLFEGRTDPTNDAFDPIRAAILFERRGNSDEAFWLVFLFIQFGKNTKTGYRLLREVYAGAGSGGLWTWKRIASDLAAFTDWLEVQIAVWVGERTLRAFGSHRGHERLELVGKTIRTYVAWVAPPRSHKELIREASVRSGHDPGRTFDDLYRGMSVYRFGRLAKFDYLAMLGKLGLANLEPPSTYVLEATGPLAGARLFYCGNKNDKTNDARLDEWLIELGRDLGVGQQVVEDALCNWQKSPAKFKMFRG